MLLSQHTQEIILAQKSKDYALKTTAELFDYLGDFIAYCDTSKSTIETYLKSLKVFFDYLLDNGITQPNREDLILFRNYLFDKGLQSTTIASYINAIKQFFKWTNNKHLYEDIAQHLKGAKVNSQYHRKEALTKEQAQEILDSIKGDTLESKRNYALMLLALCCGLRTIEISRANLNDITFKSGSKALMIQGKGKLDKADFVKLPYQVEKAIREYLLMRGIYKATDPLFTSISDRNNGGRLTTHSISRIIKNAFRKCGLDSELLTAHSTRHTFITLFLLNGGTLEEARQIARHNSINTTMIYNHAIDRAKNNGEQVLADLLIK